MLTFGQKLRFHRRQCRDPHRGGLLTQERFGELIGIELGFAGYSGAAISDWERDQSKIPEDDRLVLVCLVSILHKCGGLESPKEASELLQAGNYRALNPEESLRAFPDMEIESVQPDSSLSQIHHLAKVKEPQKNIVDQYVTPPLTQKRRKQLLLLEKVHSFWVEGVLRTSVKDDALLSPTQKHRDDLIAHPWDDVIKPAVYGSRVDFESDNIFDNYMMANRALLILGDPGAGKTMLLITLANKLIDQARTDPIAPIPVILNLGSWAEMRRPINKWVVEEFSNKYQIPRKIGQEWLEHDELVILLDGFDEIPGQYRHDCVLAINQFREMRGLTGIVVCSRSLEYNEVGIALLLGGAVTIQPLLDDQIDTFLDTQVPRLNTLRSAIKDDPALREMARSPLMLSVMGSAFSHSQEDISGVFDDRPKEPGSRISFWQRRLFNAYVQRMFQARGVSEPYTKEQTELWLGWIARRMFQFNSSQLLIEQIQPSWLPNRDWRWYYMTIVGVLSGFTGGIVMWLFLQVVRVSEPQLLSPYSSRLAQILDMGMGRTEALTIILANIILGLIVALLQGIYYEQLRRQDKESESGGRLYVRHLSTVALVVGLLTTATVVLVGDLSLALIWGLSETVIMVTIARYVYGRSYRHEIRTVESLGWSWSSALMVMGIGVILVGLSQIIGYLIFDSSYTLRTEIIVGAGGLILGGLRGQRVEKKNRPNQGIYLSIANSLKAAFVSALLVGSLAWILKSLEYAWPTGAITFIIGVGLLGGGNAGKHFLVRALLWWNGEIPWRLVGFLDYSASLAFMRKVGGSYIFLHRLLQHHFATLYAPSTRPDRLSSIDTAGLKRNLEGSKTP